MKQQLRVRTLSPLATHPEDAREDPGLGHVARHLALHGHRDADAHDPEEAGEDEVGHVYPVPDAVLQEFVVTSAAVAEDHQDDGEATRKQRV